MSSNIVTLCHAVRDALNGAEAGTFSQSFTAVFEFLPEYTPVDAKTLRVVVTDAGGDITMPARGKRGMQDRVRVSAIWRVSPTSGTAIDKTRMDEALTLMDEITEFLLCRAMGDYSQTGRILRGLGDKDKSHYYAQNLKEKTFIASIIASYVKMEDR